MHWREACLLQTNYTIYSKLFQTIGAKMLCKPSGIVITLLALGVSVGNTQDHDVRLSGTDGWRGRVEVLNGGQWGTVCPEGWDFYDAVVVCRQLGFPWADDWSLDLGAGTGPRWLRNVQCRGSEARLDECAHDGWSEQRCSDEASHPATVACVRQDQFKDMKYHAYLSNGEGLANDEGTVNLELSTGEFDRRFLLCDQGWDLDDATVVCRQRGKPSAYRATTGSYFGRPRSDPNRVQTVLATGFDCVGNESHILQCPARGWFEDDCPSGKLAGVICNNIEEPTDFQVRLANGSNPREGRVEVYANGTWGSICLTKRDAEYFSFRETGVLCRQLGQGYGLEVPIDGRFGRTSGPVALSGDVSCAGGESSFAQCYVGDATPNQDCLSSEGSVEVSVVCSGPVDESRNPVRLSSKKFREVGRLMIYHDGRWGTVCNKNWTRANAIVVCRELGLNPPEEEVASFPGDGPIHLGQVSCKGDELTLDQCQLGEWNQHDCSHTMDVHVHCTLAGASSVVSSALLIIASSLTFFGFVEY